MILLTSLSSILRGIPENAIPKHCASMIGTPVKYDNDIAGIITDIDESSDLVYIDVTDTYSKILKDDYRYALSFEIQRR